MRILLLLAAVDKNDALTAPPGFATAGLKKLEARDDIVMRESAERSRTSTTRPSTTGSRTVRLRRAQRAADSERPPTGHSRRGSCDVLYEDVRNRRAASPRSLVHNKDSGMFSYQNGRSRRRFTEKGASARDKDAASGRSPGASRPTPGSTETRPPNSSADPSMEAGRALEVRPPQVLQSFFGVGCLPAQRKPRHHGPRIYIDFERVGVAAKASPAPSTARSPSRPSSRTGRSLCGLEMALLIQNLPILRNRPDRSARFLVSRALWTIAGFKEWR